jgi:hypothetical protein
MWAAEQFEDVVSPRSSSGLVGDKALYLEKWAGDAEAADLVAVLATNTMLTKLRSISNCI